ncbi:response regulator [Thermomonas fusca]|uniref:Response regulator n=1 Tax=Thermomonas fusca TaxID=215690 RepID=A0A5R9PBY1_9GAMM|nr:response regulator [Thermomonas fusca]TLX20975.1 response regulator [Thermomonas fusca]
MRILLIDDNAPRVARIIKRLTEDLGLDYQAIVSARSTAEAATQLKVEKFDLVLLDLIIPARLDGEGDVRYALQLLSEIHEGVYLMPRKIVGLTAYDDAALAAQQTFRDGTWTLIVTNEISDEWADTIKNCVLYLRKEANQHAPRDYASDVLIVSALPKEIEAVRRLPWQWKASEPADDNTFVVRGSIQIDDKSYSVVTAHAARMGMVSAAVLTSKLIGIFAPKVCVMPGICAGIPKRTEIGDVIFADCSWDYQSGKHAMDEDGCSLFQQEPHQIAIDARVAAYIDEIAKSENSLTSIWKDWPNSPKVPFSVHRAPMASGSAVLADSDFVQSVLKQNRKIRAIEMESYGFLHACSMASEPRPLGLVAKSVCDFADNMKGDDYQAYASYTSAQTIRLFLERFLPTLAA